MPRVASGMRSPEEQAQKVAQRLSMTLASRHVVGKGADIIDRRFAWSISKSHPFWSDLGACAKAQGLTWGGNWAMQDVAHVEM